MREWYKRCFFLRCRHRDAAGDHTKENHRFMSEPKATAPVIEVVDQLPKKKSLVTLVAIGGAVLGGVGAGFVVAPRIIARQAPTAAAAAAVAENKANGGKSGEGGGMKESKIVSLDNLIVNPAGSQGTRFLMASIALEVDGAEAEKRLRDHEVEIRDLVTSILESETMQLLTAPGARDSVKSRVAVAVLPIAGKDSKLRVFLPQFVIQ